MKGEVLARLKRGEDALEAFEQSIRLEPNDASTHTSKATLLNELGQYQDALAACERAITLDVSSISAYYMKGQILQNLARYQDALAAYERVTQLDPNHIDAYAGMGLTLSQLQLYERALVAYQRAIKLRPDSAILWAAQDAVLRLLGRNQEALIAFEGAIAFEPGNARLYREKAALLQILKRPDEARAAYKKARQLGEGSSLVEMVIESVIEASPTIITLKDTKQNRLLGILATSEQVSAVTPMPQTSSPNHLARIYSLLKDIITGLGASIVMIVISELIEETFYGALVLKIVDKQVEFDARIGDIIVFARYNGTPVFIEEDVLERAARKSDTFNDNIALMEARKDLERVQHEKEAAIQQQEYELAAELREREVKLQGSVKVLEANFSKKQNNVYK